MNKIFYFLMVSVAFTGLQVATAEAADASCAKLADGSLPPHCQTDSNAADHESAGTGHHPAGVGTHAPALTIGDPLCVVAPALRDPGCPNAMPGTSATMAPPAPNMPPPTMTPPTGTTALTIGDPACITVPAAAGCPPGSPGLMDMPPTDMPPMDMPPMDMPPTDMPPPTGMSSLGDHCGAIQAKNEKKKMRKEVKCLRRALHEHKPTVKLRQTKDGLGAYGCGVKKTGSKTAQIACLRSLLDGPGGKPGMAPGTN